MQKYQRIVPNESVVRHQKNIVNKQTLYVDSFQINHFRGLSQQQAGTESKYRTWKLDMQKR